MVTASTHCNPDWPSRSQAAAEHTSMGLLEPGRRMPAKAPSALYSATVWKSRAITDTPRGCCTLGLTVMGSAGMNVAHTLPLTPAHVHSVLSETLVRVSYARLLTGREHHKQLTCSGKH